MENIKAALSNSYAGHSYFGITHMQKIILMILLYAIMYCYFFSIYSLKFCKKLVQLKFNNFFYGL